MTSHEDPFQPHPDRGRLSPIALAAAVLGLAAAAGLLLSGPGAQRGWWDIATGVEIMRWSAYAGVAAALAGVVGLWHARPGVARRGLIPASVGVVLGLASVAVPLHWERTLAAALPHHDISTDTYDPPTFSTLVARAPGPETSSPEARTAADRQRQAHPELRTLESDLTPEEVFPLALGVARDLRWRIAVADPVDRRIEATDRTVWFGLEEDVVIRIRSDQGGSRVDVRSVGRTDESHSVSNVRRIQRFLHGLGAAIAEDNEERIGPGAG